MYFIRVSHVSRMTRSYYKCKWHMSHVRTSHVTHTTRRRTCFASSRTCGRSHIRMSHGARTPRSHVSARVNMFTSRVEKRVIFQEYPHFSMYVDIIYVCACMLYARLDITLKCEESHMWMHNITHINESCHACERNMTPNMDDTSHVWMSRVPRRN